MINHPSKEVTNFIAWVWSFYRVRTKALSTVWWGRIVQRLPFWNMAAVQLGSSIWINDCDKNHDNERDYWKDDQPFACIALVAHELWHVLQKRDDKLARWKYLSPQIYAIFFIPLIVALSVFYISYWPVIVAVIGLIWMLLPAHATTRLLQECEAYAWNRYVADLLSEHHLPTLQLLEIQRAEFMCGPAYYYMTRDVEEARSFLVRCERIPYTEPALQLEIKQAVTALKQAI